MNEQEIKVEGTPIQSAENVSVDTPNVQAQRKIYTTKADSYIREVGVFDWNLFGAISCVRYPDGKLEVVDGGHRLYLVKKYLPDVTEVPAIILNGNSKEWTVEQSAQLFHRLNGTCSKAVNNEEKFVAQVLGKEVGALELEKGLKECKARVTSADNTVGLKKGKTIKIAKWQSFWKKDQNRTKKACELINEVYNLDGHYNVMFLEGLINLIKFIDKDLMDWDKYETDFVSFLEDKSKTVEQNKMSYPQLRKDNHYGISVAYGLYCDWYDWCKINNKRAPFAKKVIGEVYAKAGQLE